MIKFEKTWKQIILLSTSFAILLILCVSGIGLYRRNLAETDFKDVFRQNAQLESYINDVTLKLFAENEIFKTNKSDYIDIFINENSDITKEEKEILETYLRRNYIDYLGDIYNLDAVFIDNTTNKQIYFNKGSMIAHDLGSVNANDVRFWYRVDFDSKGNQTISSLDPKVVYNNNSITKVAMDLKYAYSNQTNNDMSGYSSSMSDDNSTVLIEDRLPQSDLKIPQIKDCTIIFSIPNTFGQYDSITNIIDSYSGGLPYYQIENLYIMSMFVFTILAFFVSFNQVRATHYGEVLDKTWWEIRLVIVITIFIISISIPFDIFSGLVYSVSTFTNGRTIFDILIQSLTQFGVLVFEYIGIIISVYWFKSIFKDGWKVNAKKFKINSLTVSFLQICRNWMLSLVTIKLSKDAYIKLAGILVLNVLLLSGLILIFGYWFGSIIYSIALAFCAIYFMKEIQKNYQKLLECTQRLSNGDLSTEIEENLGAFEPLKNELENIRIGFKVAIDEETKSQKMKTELISNVSHDLKTPLTSMISYIDLLKKEKDAKKKKEYLETVERNSLRLKHLIEDLFEVSKANSGDIKLEVMDVDIVSLVNQTLFECKPQIDKANIKFKTTYSRDKIILKLDAHKTYRIIENVITNAYKYSVEGTRVYIDIVENEYDVVFSIRNVSVEEIMFDPNDLVERFIRGDKSRNSDGSGLGLAIAKGFTEAQNGKFNIETDGDYFKVIVRFVKD